MKKIIKSNNPQRVDRSLWQIFVPVTDNSGIEFTVLHHKKWDVKVQDISGGLTINKKSRGIWQNPITGKVFEEQVLPVLIDCDLNDMEKIMEMTLEHYNQEAVMCYKVSDEVFVLEKEKLYGKR